MTGPDDYLPDMPYAAITDSEVEDLLSRRGRSDSRFNHLAAALSRIELSRLEVNLDDGIGRLSLRAAALAREGRAVSKRGWLARLTPRLAGTAMMAIVLLGTTGVALAADASVPGDLLYGLDRAAERIGLNDGGIQERLEEANVIASKGDSEAALTHIAESLKENDSSQAADALQRAAERVRTVSEVPEVQTSVTDMLDWMATTDADGRDFGQGVAERAKDLGRQGNNKPSPDTSPGKGKGPPGGSPPGQSGK